MAGEQKVADNLGGYQVFQPRSVGHGGHHRRFGPCFRAVKLASGHYTRLS